MSEYQETEKLLDELMALDNYKLTKAIENLTSRQIQLLNWKMPYLNTKVRILTKQLKAAHIERSTNYDKLIKKARTMFCDLDIEILEMLNNDEMSWYARGIARHVNGDSDKWTKYSLDAVRKRLRLLKRRGLVEVISGLMDEEDGMLAGSGYSAVYKQQSNIEKIIASYKGENDTKELL